ncbi:enoyl-CoA hydratase/isomerase family protein [Phenylobacterium sp.]|jgi:enoyl-CoA hydratase/carnithine racemase|uniref:enoyl-CoA hydratase/isomerase family protein n=1 Tax=Phenylobacterium sp. TaxID=1871053 RepID=UPI002F426C51
MTDAPLIVSEEPGIIICTLNRPAKLNAINQQMIRGIREAVQTYAQRPDLRVFLLRATGRYFSAGADQLDRSGTGPDPKSTSAIREWYRTEMMSGMQPLYDQMEAIEKPFVAAHQATCMGGGLEMSLSCDFRLAAKSASYALPENKLGAIPASGGVSRLTRLVGPHWSKWMIMGGQAVDADLARTIGLAHAVYADDEFEAKVMEFCRHLAVQPVETIGMAKLTINLCADADPGASRMVERLGQSILHIGEESAVLHEAMRRKLSKTG